ncbi:hypothetical protein, partial [Kitasatospora sp. NPDC093558]|uniref:hypothetical protein n=1 Tax=Kitasatospora sp. NPDC093558 TaxID=3155201 RepID=UPI003440F41B
MSDETPPQYPQYRSYSWEDEQGGFYLVLYPDDEEADEERKAHLRAMGARMAADLVAEQQPEPTRPALRLVRD